MTAEAFLVLLVEDNPDHAELVVRALAERTPIQVRHVGDGQAALDYLFGRGEYAGADANPRPNVVLLDLRLPKVDGLSVLRELKASPELRGIPVVVLTTSEAERDIVQAYDQYVNSYVVKPIGFEPFCAMVQGLSSYWLSWNKFPKR